VNSDDRIAIVTPSYARDFELCKTLNRSVLEFLPEDVKHYIFVDRRDLELFRPLSGARTEVAAKEEIMPSGIVQLPGVNRWVSGATLLPISGWLVQQIAKIAAAKVLDEPTLVMVDSDAVFVRDVEANIFASAGQTRLYRSSGAITAGMSDHLAWYRNACKLLAIAPETAPVDDYIGQIISWDRRLVSEMCTHIERVNSLPWYSAMARARRVSEYLIYGLFVERVAGVAGNVWIDGHARCSARWELYAMPGSKSEEFAGSLNESDVALMISSHSQTTHEVRRAVIEFATNGRIR
jgi:hypothetical protein